MLVPFDEVRSTPNRMCNAQVEIMQFRLFAQQPFPGAGHKIIVKCSVIESLSLNLAWDTILLAMPEVII